MVALFLNKNVCGFFNTATDTRGIVDVFLTNEMESLLCSSEEIVHAGDRTRYSQYKDLGEQNARVTRAM